MKSKHHIAGLLYFLLLLISNCKEDDDDVVKTLIPPGNLTTHVISSTQVDLQWMDKSGDEAGFKIERAPGGSGAFAEVASVGSGVTAFQNSGLNPNTAYVYRVKAYNGKTSSAYSNEASATTPGSPPSAPSGLTASIISAVQIDLTWVDNSSDEQGFSIEQEIQGSATFIEIATVAPGVIAYQQKGLSASTTYRYRVRAFNASGNSAYSNIISAATSTANIAPSAPSNLAAAAISGMEVTLSWTDNSTNEQGFRVERAPGGTATFAEVATVGPGITTFNNTGLAANTSYSYRVTAYNNFGNSPYSNTADVTTLSLPAPPSGLAATATSTTEINLNWTDTSNDESGFEIERAPGTTTSFTQIASVGADVRTFRNSGLTANTNYSYRVRAFNAIGNSEYSNTASAITKKTIPAAPANLSGSGASFSQINLTWTDYADNEEGFKIERAPGSTNTFTEIATVNANVTTYASTGLAGGASYSYRVRAFNSGGNSAYSNVATASTLTQKAILRVVNNTKYLLYGVRLNSIQRVPAGSYYDIGRSIEVEFSSGGTVNYFLEVGLYNGSSWDGFFTLTGSVTVTLGSTSTVTFNNPTINQLLSKFSSSNLWDGYYFDAYYNMHTAGYRFYSNGSWNFYDDGVNTGSGTYTLVSWPNYSTIVTFKTCSSCAGIQLAYPFSSFLYRNGPASWPIIEYIDQ